MIRCPRCGRFAAQTSDEDLQRAVKFLATELKQGPRKIQELRQALIERGEVISDEHLSQAARHLDLDENAEGALETSPLVDLGSSFLEYVTEEQESSTGTGKETDQPVETEPLGVPEFELNIGSTDAEVAGAVRIVNACGGCRRPLLDYHFTVRERREHRRFELTFDPALGELRKHHVLDTSSDWFQELAAEEQETTERLWKDSHGLLLDVRHVGRRRMLKTDQHDGRTYQGFNLRYVVICKCGCYRFEGYFDGSVHTSQMRSLVTKSEMDDYNLEFFMDPTKQVTK